MALSDGSAGGVGSDLGSQLRGEVSGFLRVGENLRGDNLVLALAVAFIIQEGKKAVADNGPSEAGAELVARELGLVGVRQCKEVACIENTIAQKVVSGAVERVGSRLNAGIDDSAPEPSGVCGVVIGFYFELLQGIHRRVSDRAR